MCVAQLTYFSLGWTGDLQAFAPTANYLYDTSGFLTNWLHDLYEEQIKDSQGAPPVVVPNTLLNNGPNPFPQAVWVSLPVRILETVLTTTG